MLKRFNHSHLKNLSLIILTLLLLPHYSFSQELDVTSLLKLANTSTEVKERIEAYNELAWKFRYKNTGRGLIYADSAIQLSQGAGFSARECTAHSRAGEIQLHRGQLLTAQDHYEKSLSLAESINHPYFIGRAANSLSIIHRRLGNSEISIQYGRKASVMFDTPTHRSVLPVALDNLGLAFLSRSSYDSAFYFLNLALESRLPTNDSTQLRESYINLAYLYFVTEDYTRALENNNRALATFESHMDSSLLGKVHENIGNIFYRQGRFDDAEASHLKSLNIRESRNDSIAIANSLHNLGLISEIRGEYEKAINYIRSGLKIYEKRNYRRATLKGYVSLGNLFFDSNAYDEAFENLKKAYELAEELNLLSNFPNVALRLALIYEYQGQTEDALKYSFEFGKIESESRQAINRASRLELSVVEGKSSEALIFERHLNSNLKIKNNLLTITLLIVGIIFTTMLFVSLIAYLKLRQKKVLAEKNERIRHQENEELLKKQELAAFNAMLEGQEKERKRIARDLHDRIGSMLSMVKIHFKSVEDNLEALKSNNKEQYTKANQLLDEACDEVRKVAHDMVSGVLMKFGLVSALKNLCSSVQSTGQLKMELIDFGLDERLDYEYEINIYRIVQELLSNVLKHAEATEMTIQLLKKEETIHMIVEDDGKGFIIESPEFEQGMGLKNIKSRVFKLDGELSIDSGKGAGTTITIDLKLDNGRKD